MVLVLWFFLWLGGILSYLQNHRTVNGQKCSNPRDLEISLQNIDIDLTWRLQMVYHGEKIWSKVVYIRRRRIDVL